MEKGPDPTVVRDRQSFNKVYRSYHRVSRWSRVATALFWILILVIVLWLIPWLPLGLSSTDYSPEVLLAFVLLGLCPAVTATVLLTKGIVKQRREALAAWSSIYDAQTGLRNREYFFERLKVQCQLGRELAEYRVGLILVKVEEPVRDGSGMGPADEKVFRLLGMSIANQMRPSDLVAVIDEKEIGILVSAASPTGLEIVSERIRRCLGKEVETMARGYGSRLMIEMGIVSGDDGADPDSLLEAARVSLKVISIEGRRVGAA
ncbi:MAG: diguanylate cyclase [Dehalococcoidia bacterium]|nr:diguanylate cyclase [Dehalococcoidia bacterium]